MSNRAKKQAKLLDEILVLQTKRRLDITKCIICLAAILVFVCGKTYLVTQGILVDNNLGIGAVTMAVAVGLAIYGGRASIDFTKTGHRIQELRQAGGITIEDIKEHKDSC